MSSHLRLTPLLLVGAWLAPLGAQEHAHRPSEKLGRVTFPVSCSAEARLRFERAMGVLHSFWWEEGRNAFGAVLEADSTCAMAHWGLAINAWGNPFVGGPTGNDLKAGATAAERAAAMGAPTARERGFIAAAAALYRDYATVPAPQRLRAYSDMLARLSRDEPNDPEAALYYALSLVATASPTDTTFARQKAAAAILNPLFARFPDHPGLAHYIIHSNDSPALAPLGLEAAQRYAGIAPDAPHAQHMPSHIFIRLGLWDETVESNRRSYEAGVAYARAQGLHGVNYHEFHALDYMVYGYLQQGRDSAANAIVAKALALTDVRAPSELQRSYNQTAMELRLPLERGDWKAAARLPVRTADTPVAEMLSRFARGIGAARSGNLVQARDELQALRRVEQTLTTRNDSYWARTAGIKAQALNAWTLLAAHDTAGALREATAAADAEDVTQKHPITPGELLPARELEADMHLALGHVAAARAAYLVTLKHERGRSRAIFGAARAADLAGDRTAAAAGYRALVSQMAKGDGKRPELAVAQKATAGQ